MSEMIERVARAIGRGAFADQEQEDDEWPNWVPEARAAIEAMREPTDKMLEAQYGRAPGHLNAIEP